MGMEQLPSIVEQLIKYGRAASTPVGLVRWGTTPRQQALIGTLGDIVEKVKASGFGPPAIIVVGEVVSLREKLRWFDTRPLFGQRVLVTRSRDQASELELLLSDLGAVTVELPTIETRRMEDYSKLDEAVGRVSEFAWIVFTSANGVRYFFERLRHLGLDARVLGGLRLAAIGPKTSAELEKHGLWSDLVPEEFVAEKIVEEFRKENLAGKRVLLARADIAREMLAEELGKMGAEVEEIAVYRTVAAEEGQARGRAMLELGEIDIVTFTSSSTVRNLAALFPKEEFPQLLAKTRVAVIGPITAKTVEDLGARVDIRAKEYTIEGLVKAIVEQLP